MRQTRIEHEAYAWAAMAPAEATPSRYIHPNSIRSTRTQVQTYIGAVFAPRGQTPLQGWRRAKRAGWTAVKVHVRWHPDSP